MPTITVRSAPLALNDQKRISLAFTKVLKGLGADPSHCLVFFNSTSNSALFRAGMPLPDFDKNGNPLNFFIRANISIERDNADRHELAYGLYESLKVHYADSFIYIQFDAIDPNYVFYSAENMLHNAGQK